MYTNIKKNAGMLFGTILLGGGIFLIYKHCADILKRERIQKEKNRAILKMFSKWIQNKEEGKKIETYLNEMGFHKIAIYGMSDAGQRLYEELNGTSIKIEYAIDRRTVDVAENIPIVSLDNVLHKVDAIVVTAIYDFPEIVELLQNKTQDYIISLKQIIYEL